MSDPAQRERELKERLIAMRKLRAAQASPDTTNNNSPKSIVEADSISPSVVPVPIPAPVSNATAIVEDQSSAEEGEIEEDDPIVQMTEAVPSYPVNNHYPLQPNNNKRKHGPNHTTRAGKNASKKARKKMKKQAKNGT